MSSSSKNSKAHNTPNTEPNVSSAEAEPPLTSRVNVEEYRFSIINSIRESGEELEAINSTEVNWDIKTTSNQQSGSKPTTGEGRISECERPSIRRSQTAADRPALVKPQVGRMKRSSSYNAHHPLPTLTLKRNKSEDIHSQPLTPVSFGEGSDYGSIKNYKSSLFGSSSKNSQSSQGKLQVGVNFSSSHSSESPIKTLARRMRRESRQSIESQSHGPEVLIGTPVKKGHKNYVLMFDMLTGIRMSTMRVNSKSPRALEPEDFSQRHKLAFDEDGIEMMPKSEYDFKFKDYAPFVFQKIREIFNVDTKDYLQSLTGKYVLSELGSPGKSGSFFYFSADYRFIIKTVHHSEHKFILKILSQYLEYARKHPNTLLSRILGAHRVKLRGNEKIHFVVMANVFPPHKDMHEVYDLKGSLIGREIKQEELLKKGSTAVQKDLNWLKSDKKLFLGPTKANLLINQIEKDVEYLKKNKIMDYSLLVGIHDMKKGNKELVREKSLVIFDQPMPVDDSQVERPHSIVGDKVTSSRRSKDVRSPHKKTPRMRTISDPVALTPINNKLDESNNPPERRYVLFYKDHGGFQATGEADEPLPLLYFIGIIDIFTKYNKKKRIETVLRSIAHATTKKISAVKPKYYGKRFVRFMKAAISSSNPS